MKIEEVRVVDSVPEGMNESNHYSQFIAVTGKEPIEGKGFRREFYQPSREGSNKIVILNIDGKEYWSRESEYRLVEHILPTVKDNKILLWYEAGSVSPMLPTKRGSGLDAYRVHIAYNV